MPKVRIYDPRGKMEAEGEVPAGTNLLKASTELGARHGSACGGVCSCKAFDVKAWSRLGCQAELDHAEVEYQITEESEKTWYDEHPKERHEAEAKGLWPPKK